ncbi:MAG: hemerythrin family protein [Spirochaetaceae bacterium]|nr:hemerythrin family protein [Spirochaetaceae bacterium]MBR2361721.1 hemerythrin family protein [Spirochaetaceae bacterium]
MGDEMQTPMEWVPWEKKYEMGISMLDTQNKELVALCNTLRARLMERNRGDGVDWKVALALALRESVKYTKAHFVAQERMMQQTNYPKYLQHKQYHQEFVESITHVLNSFSGATKQTAFEFSSFLREWTLSHIAHDDQEFAKYFFDPNRKKSS